MTDGRQQMILKSHLAFGQVRYTKYNRVSVMVFNATFHNISVISWQSVFLMEEIRGHWQTLYHNVISSTPRL